MTHILSTLILQYGCENKTISWSGFFIPYFMSINFIVLMKDCCHLKHLLLLSYDDILRFDWEILSIFCAVCVNVSMSPCFRVGFRKQKSTTRLLKIESSYWIQFHYENNSNSFGWSNSYEFTKIHCTIWLTRLNSSESRYFARQNELCCFDAEQKNAAKMIQLTQLTAFYNFRVVLHKAMRFHDYLACYFYKGIHLICSS